MLAQSWISFLLHKLRSVLSRFLFQHPFRRQDVAVDRIPRHGEHIGLRIGKHVFEEEFRIPQALLEIDKQDGSGWHVICKWLWGHLLFGIEYFGEDALSFVRIISIKQLQIE